MAFCDNKLKSFIGCLNRVVLSKLCGVISMGCPSKDKNCDKDKKAAPAEVKKGR
jgi:hypothetical protein